MAKQITVLPQWADGAAATVTVPPTAKKQQGWVGGPSPEQPPADWANWLYRTAYENLAFIADNIFFGDLGRIYPIPNNPAPTASSIVNQSYVSQGFTAIHINSGNPTIYGRLVQQECYAQRGSLGLLVGGNYTGSPGSGAAAIAATTAWNFATFNKGQSFQVSMPTALSSVMPVGVVWSAQDGFVVACESRSTYRLAYLRSTDLVTWTFSHDPVTQTTGGSCAFFFRWDAVSAYYNINLYGSALQQHRVLVGSLSAGSWATFTHSVSGTNGFVVDGPVTANNRYMLAAGYESSVANQLHVWYATSASPTAWAWAGKFVDSTYVFGGANSTYSTAVSYNKGMFIIKTGAWNGSYNTNKFLILDGTTGNPGTAGHWASVTCAGDMLPPLINYDSKRDIWIAHGTALSGVGGTPFVYVSQGGLSGPWRRINIPALSSAYLGNNNTSYGLAFFRVYKTEETSYLAERYNGFMTSQLAASAAASASGVVLSDMAYMLQFIGAGERSFY